MPLETGKTGLIRLDAFIKALDQVQGGINGPRAAENAVVQGGLSVVQTICAEASDPHVVDDPRVVAAWAALVNSVVVHLSYRAAAYTAETKEGFFRMLARKRAIHRADRTACEALIALNAAIHDAWIAAEGSDPRPLRAALADKIRTEALVESGAKSSKFDTVLHELSVSILGQTISFATSVADEFDDFAECQLFGLSANDLSHPRFFSDGPPKRTKTTVNQLVLSFGALSFFLYVLDLTLYLTKDEVLREAIFDPTASSLIKVFIDMRDAVHGKLYGKGNTASYRKAIADLHEQYAKAPTLFGEDASDKNSGLSLATRAIADAAGRSNSPFFEVILHELVVSLKKLDFQNRIKALRAEIGRPEPEQPKVECYEGTDVPNPTREIRENSETRILFVGGEAEKQATRRHFPRAPTQSMKKSMTP